MNRWDGYGELYHRYNASEQRIKREKTTEACLNAIDKKIKDLDTSGMRDKDIRLEICEIIDNTYSDYGISINDEDFNKLATKYTKSLCHGELYHHGIEGQKWGVRRYQNPDGSLTEEGKQRYRITPLKDKIEGKKGIEFIKGVGKHIKEEYDVMTQLYVDNLLADLHYEKMDEYIKEGIGRTKRAFKYYSLKDAFDNLDLMNDEAYYKVRNRNNNTNSGGYNHQ